MKKLLKTVIIIVAAFAVVLLGARCWFRLPVEKYYSASEKGFEIPDTDKGFIAQGLAYSEEEKLFFATGYMKDKSASPLYIISSGNGGMEKKLLLTNEDGKDYTGHSGGLTVHGEYIYVASGKGVNVYLLEDALKAENGDRISCVGHFSTKADDNDYVGAAFVSTDGERLWIGEFYREQNYKTLSSHHIETPSGETNRAFAVAFDFDENAEYGVDSTPVMLYSLPDLVQGMCFDDGKVYLSTSYAVAFSHIFVYETEKAEYIGELNVLGKNIPAYALDKNVLASDVKIAPMSEEIVFADGKMFTMCESASDKYIFGKLTGAKYCWKTDMSALEK